jgi:DNA polymerase III alpha subunit
MHPAAITVLKERLLLGDGTSVVEPESVYELLLRQVPPSKIKLTEHSLDTIKFNERSEVQLLEFSVDQELSFSPKWLIPERYLNLDLQDYFANEIVQKKLNEQQIERVCEELHQVYKFNFENGLRTIIYVVETFKKNNQLWGIGRGSSCASYLLYLIGLHQVNPLQYNIHWSEFFHD